MLLPTFYLGIGFVTEPIGVLFLNCFMELFPDTLKVTNYFISVMICELIRFLIVVIIKNYWNGQLINLPLRINILLCSIPTLGIISCCIIIRIVWLYDMLEGDFLCVGIIFMVLFSNILVFVVFKKVNRMYIEVCKKEMMIQEAKLKEEYYLEVDKSSRNLRKIRHDLKNRLVGIYGIEDNEALMRRKIKEIIGELEESSQNLYTSNCVLNSVLNIKYKSAFSEKIRVQNAIMVPKYMNIDCGDMGVLFGNLLDNAIEANRLVEEKNRWIDVSVNYEEHILVINIKNSKLSGSNKERKDYLNHGIGLNSVRQIVEKYNGIAEFQDLGDTFEASAILYGIYNDMDFEKERLKE
uniref:sensor histidine kinase n=1 Tax=Agathobacter sp. TaxID=2021311 RepID=UPI004055B0AD